MKITEVETHHIYPPYQAWNSEALMLYHGPLIRHRVVCVVRTDNGLEGLGEHVGPQQWPGIEDWIERMRGTAPQKLRSTSCRGPWRLNSVLTTSR